MEWFLLVLAATLFIVVPICLIYDMIANPEQFGGTEPAYKDHLDYEPDLYDDITEFYLPMIALYTFCFIPGAIVLYIWFAAAAVFRGIWWCLTGGFMETKDKWWERIPA